MRERWQTYWRDYYEILQLNPSAEIEVVEGAFRRLALKYHSDKPDLGDKERMILLNEAHDILRNASKRLEYDAAYNRRRRPESAPKPAPEVVLRVSVVSITGSVSRAGNRYRFQVRVEGDNESSCPLGWSGVTINAPTVDAPERYLATEIQMSSLGCTAPFRHGPGDEIWGFLDDGSFGKKAATSLFMESVREQWPPHERIALEAVLVTPCSRLDLHVRVWSNRPNDGGAFGDPAWNTTKQKDQQGIPAYSLSLGLD
jgi:hypothetical protein